MDSKIQRIKNFGHLLLASGANALYAFPSKGMVVIGVTGTDGKTTTSSLIYHILKKAGKKAALISTIGAVIDDEEYETGHHTTTPSSFQIQKYLKLAIQKNCTHAVIEVTSHGLDQNRVFGIDFDIGILTNITREHLNYHKTYKNYVYAKLKLLQNSKIKIVNSKGPWFEYVQKEIYKEKLITYSLDGHLKEDVTPNSLPFKIKTKLLGDFNKENIMASVCACMALDIPINDIDGGIEDFTAPIGRQQIIENSKIGMVMIDFAHTPGAFERILPEIKKITEGRLIHVFGSAGQRDIEKRSEMGKISSKYADIIILTAEDPRNELISMINDQIKSGINNSFKFEKDKTEFKSNSIYEVPDRKEAILFALSKASKKDTVIITGKGHERSINLGHGEIPWSDEKVVRRFLEKN